MKVGIVIDQPMQVGGGFSHAVSSTLLWIEALRADHEVIVLTTVKKNVGTLSRLGINSQVLHRVGCDLADSYPITSYLHPRLRSLMNWLVRRRNLDQLFEDLNINLIYFTSNSDLAQRITRCNFVYTVWDLAYRDHPEFPEKRSGFDEESYYSSILYRAAAVIVDTTILKQKICTIFHVEPNKVHVVPFKPSYFLKHIDPFENKNEKKYIFYPAQFWPHKNHIYILEALSILLKKHISIDVIFSGSDLGNLSFIKRKSEELGVESLIHYAGFVTDDEYYRLMAGSLALVMPTFFGPSNIPPIDAFLLGIPVIYPNQDGFDPDIASAVIPVDLSSPYSLSEQLEWLIYDDNYSQPFISAGFDYIERLREFDSKVLIKKLVSDFEVKLKCWK